MNRILLIYKIIRPVNIVLSLISIIIAAFLIDEMNHPNLFFICVMIISFNGAANMLNDLFDIEIDKINCPDRLLLSNKRNINDIRIGMVILFFSGIICSFYVEPFGRNIALFLALPLIILYTPFLKPLPLIGNVVVSIIVGMVFIVTESSITNSVDKMWIPFVLVAVLTLIREIVKDVADINGDGVRQQNAPFEDRNCNGELDHSARRMGVSFSG